MVTRTEKKTPVERIILTFDFTERLKSSGANLTGNPTVTIERLDCDGRTDALPTLGSDGASISEDKKVLVPIEGGTLGQTSLIRVKCPTDNNQILEINRKLEIQLIF